MEEKNANIGELLPPTLQLPWEVLEPLAVALHKLGIDASAESKFVGKLEAQAEHLKDLRNIILSFIHNKEQSIDITKEDKQ